MDRPLTLKSTVLRIILLVIICFSLFGMLQWVQASQPGLAKDSAALVKIQGAIGPASQDFIQRSIKKAVDKNSRLMILQLDTPGGLSSSMRLIIQDILASPIPIVTYVAPAGSRAASAGTYILYASHIAAMAPGTNLGAATPVQISTPGIDDKKEEKDKQAEKKKSETELKAINDAKAYIRSLAQLRKRNVEWAESAVTKAESLSAEEALKLNVINVVAQSIPELLQKIDGMVVQMQAGSLTIKSKDLTVFSIEPDWRTNFLAIITDPSVAYILLMIGIYGIFFEFFNPGFVLPGVVGAICLLVALYAFQLLPINYVGLALIILGIIFIVAEAFMPSFGALGIGGVISLAIGSVFLLRTEGYGYTIPLQLIAGVVLTTILFFATILTLAIRSRQRKIVSGVEGMVGKQGEIVVQNNQQWVMIEGELWHFQADEKLSAGQLVEIENISGLTVKVKKIN